jgi:hypothetical protein
MRSSKKNTTASKVKLKTLEAGLSRLKNGRLGLETAVYNLSRRLIALSPTSVAIGRAPSMIGPPILLPIRMVLRIEIPRLSICKNRLPGPIIHANGILAGNDRPDKIVGAQVQDGQ